MNDKKIYAVLLRKKGYSYNYISTKLKIAKSTLSDWFGKDNELKSVTLKNIQKAKAIWSASLKQYNKQRAQIIREKWSVHREEISKSVGILTKRELLLIGAALYWAEGYNKGRWSVIFCNADPMMIKIIMRLFLEICKIPLTKIKGQVQVHSPSNIAPARQYWSTISGIPHDQFMKPLSQITKSSKGVAQKRLPFGTFRIRINDVYLVNTIKGWIGGLKRV